MRAPLRKVASRQLSVRDQHQKVLTWFWRYQWIRDKSRSRGKRLYASETKLPVAALDDPYAVLALRIPNGEKIAPARPRRIVSELLVACVGRDESQRINVALVKPSQREAASPNN